jgi:hypothetical protein
MAMHTLSIYSLILFSTTAGINQFPFFKTLNIFPGYKNFSKKTHLLYSDSKVVQKAKGAPTAIAHPTAISLAVPVAS